MNNCTISERNEVQTICIGRLILVKFSSQILVVSRWGGLANSPCLRTRADGELRGYRGSGPVHSSRVSPLPALVETGGFSEISLENSTLSQSIIGRQLPCQRPRSLQRTTSVPDSKVEQLPLSIPWQGFCNFLWRLTQHHVWQSWQTCNAMSQCGNLTCNCNWAVYDVLEKSAKENPFWLFCQMSQNL